MSREKIPGLKAAIIDLLTRKGELSTPDIAKELITLCPTTMAPYRFRVYMSQVMGQLNTGKASQITFRRGGVGNSYIFRMKDAEKLEEAKRVVPKQPKSHVPTFTGKQFREYMERERQRFAQVAGEHLISEDEQWSRRSYHGKEITGTPPLRDARASAMAVRTASIDQYR